jgi:hypothetical protein
MLGYRLSAGLAGMTDMAEFRDRDLHLVKKALATAVLAIERQPGPFSDSD